MPNVKLPKQVDPHKSALKRSDYQGLIVRKDMLRLSDAVVEVLDDVTVKLRFEIDAQGLTFFHGSLQTKVVLECQRSNEPFELSICHQFCYTPVREGEDIDEIPEAYEPVELDEHGEINILELFEDELILSLPIVPKRELPDSEVTEATMTFGDIEPEVERPNPFAVLKELKRNQE